MPCFNPSHLLYTTCLFFSAIRYSLTRLRTARDGLMSGKTSRNHWSRVRTDSFVTVSVKVSLGSSQSDSQRLPEATAPRGRSESAANVEPSASKFLTEATRVLGAVKVFSEG